jgi:hypothetical protein
MTLNKVRFLSDQTVSFQVVVDWADFYLLYLGILRGREGGVLGIGIALEQDHPVSITRTIYSFEHIKIGANTFWLNVPMVSSSNASSSDILSTFTIPKLWNKRN